MVILGGIRQGQADYKRSKAKDSTEAVGLGLNAQAGKLESEARQWWEKSAAKGNYYALAHLGQMMEDGIAGYEKNEEEAEKRYKEGIRHGNSLSMFYYGLMLSKKPDQLIRQELAALREQDKLTPDLVFRDPYFLDFLGLKDRFIEKDLEDAIMREMENFILVLKYKFTSRRKHMVSEIKISLPLGSR